MQYKAVYLLFCKFTLYVSGVNHTPSSGIHKPVPLAMCFVTACTYDVSTYVLISHMLPLVSRRTFRQTF